MGNIASIGSVAGMAPGTDGQGAPPPLSQHFSVCPSFAAIAAGQSTLAPASSDSYAVQLLQSALIYLDYKGIDAADGTFSAGTTAALKQFQADSGLPASGTLDAATLLRLDNWCAARDRGEAAQGPAAAAATAVRPPAPPSDSAGVEALAVARRYVEMNIKGDPNARPEKSDHTQDGPEIQHFTGGNAEPWCADFVKTCFAEAGYPLPTYQRSESAKWVPGMASMLQQNFFTGRQSQPRPGDIIFFGKCKPEAGDFDGLKHVGIVESVDPDGTIHTIEGNTGDGISADGDALLRKKHRVGDGWVAGFARA
jgi:hypothetical protein